MAARGVDFSESADAPSFTALHFMFYIGDGPSHPDACDCIRFLVSDCGTPINRPDDYGKTELHYAVGARTDVKIIETLLDLGCDPNVDDGRDGTPLSLALFVKPRQWDSAAAMVEAGGDLESRIRGGVPLIHSLRRVVKGSDKTRLAEYGW